MRTELVPASIGEPERRFDLVGIDGASPPPIKDERERLHADFIRSLQDGARNEVAGVQGMMLVGNAYRAIEKVLVADMQSRRKHRVDLIV